MTGITEVEIAGRLFLGALLGGGIGLERQTHGRPAGFRTHLLVCVASVLLMIVSQSLGGGSDDGAFRFDPGRLAAGAITGVGFLGAGVILKSGLNVHGLTTAACLWIVSAIGLAVGSGMHLAALVAFAITLSALWLLHYVEDLIPRVAYRQVMVVADRGVDEEQVRAAVTGHGPKVTRLAYDLDAAAGTMTYRFSIATQHRNSERRIVDALAGHAGVRRVTVHD